MDFRFKVIHWFCTKISQYKTTQVEKTTKTVAEVIDVVHKNSILEFMTPVFSKVASILVIIPKHDAQQSAY